MKKSKFRLFLIITSLWPAMFFCVTFALGGIVGFAKSHNVLDLLLTIPFISCVLIFGMFCHDTLILYKVGE